MGGPLRYPANDHDYFLLTASTYRNWSPFAPNDAGGLEECAHLWGPTDPFAGFWNDADPEAVEVIDGRSIVTLPLAHAQEFFRLVWP